MRKSENPCQSDLQRSTSNRITVWLRTSPPVHTETWLMHSLPPPGLTCARSSEAMHASFCLFAAKCSYSPLFAQFSPCDSYDWKWFRSALFQGRLRKSVLFSSARSFASQLPLPSTCCVGLCCTGRGNCFGAAVAVCMVLWLRIESRLDIPAGKAGRLRS